MKLAISLFLVLISVCGEGFSDVQNATLDQEFQIKIGQSVQFNKEELQIKFASVLEDSRCPEGAQCITAGNAKIKLELRWEKDAPASVSINTASTPQEADFQGYRIHLMGLDPYPSTKKNFSPEDYVATLVVSISENGE